MAMNDSKPRTRIFCESDLSQDAETALDAGPAHKLRAVLRAQVGDEILLFNGRDGEWRAELTALGKTKAQARCREQTRRQAAEPGPWLVFAPLKKDRLDQVVEKAVELGVERLIPVITQRTENRRMKMERLQSQIIDAAEQCERLTLPQINAPIALDHLPRMWAKERKLLVAAERRDAPALTDSLSAPAETLGLLIGPEGGFTPQELDWIVNLPISIPVSLGPRILRAETAAIAALAVIQAQCGDWRPRKKAPKNYKA